MKFLVISSLMLISAPVFANSCETIDGALNRANRGTGTTMQVLEMALCNIEGSRAKDSLCGTRIGIRKDIIAETKALFEVGELTNTDLDRAHAALAATRAACRN